MICFFLTISTREKTYSLFRGMLHTAGLPSPCLLSPSLNLLFALSPSLVEADWLKPAAERALPRRRSGARAGGLGSGARPSPGSRRASGRAAGLRAGASAASPPPYVRAPCLGPRLRGSAPELPRDTRRCLGDWGSAAPRGRGCFHNWLAVARR